MANRILRDWTASESIDGLSEGAEIFFTRLIMKADDFGCFYGNPKLLHSALFPLRNYSSDKILKLRGECQSAGIIEVYQVDGKDYVKIKNFGQRLRIMNSKFPQPSDGVPLTNDRQVLTGDSMSPPETKRNEVETEVETETKSQRAIVQDVFFGEEMQAVWEEWKKYRIEIKKKLSPSTEKKQMQFLGGRAGPEAIAIINQSITKGWTGLFELKENGHDRKGSKQTVRRADAVIETGREFGSFK